MDLRLDAEVAALIALRAMLDGIASSRSSYTGLAIAVGQTAEHEAKIRMWEARDRDSFHELQDFLRRTDATSHHRRAVSIHHFNKHLESGTFGQGWTPWSPEVHFRVGAALIEAVMRSTGWFEQVPDPEHRFKQGQKHGPKNVIMPRPGLVKWLDDALTREGIMSPEFKPTVVPPKPWEGTTGGGYWTPYVRTPRLIRFKASQVQQQENAREDYNSYASDAEHAAIHALQNTPWRINKRVLEVAKWAVAADRGIAKLPHSKPLAEEILALPEDEARDPKKLKSWKRRMSRAIRADIKRVSKIAAVGRTLRVAMEYSAFERFYFPHMMDFRGRKYPIPTGLQPQGDDLARGMLEFADGKGITEENEGHLWLAIHLASSWGHDKWDNARRIQWVHDNEALFRRIAADPIANTEWSVTKGPDKVDKPFVALAAIFDWVSFLDHGFGYVSHTPVSVDGTCNGIQHLAAMVRDPVLGAHVNLVPADEPQDIYKFVAQELQPVIERLEKARGPDKENAAFWLELCGRDLPRSLTKRQVMVMPYGGTQESYFTYTRQWLDENHPMPDTLSEDQEAALLRWLRRQSGGTQSKTKTWAKQRDIPLSYAALSAQRTARVTFMASLMWNRVGTLAPSAMGVMEWLQKTAKHATEANQPIFWVTPTGFVVRHFYGKQVYRNVKTVLNGEAVQVLIGVTTKELDIKSQLQGIAPNFVHSLDAAALTKTIEYCTESGIGHITAVHDAYGTHAADMWALYKHLRQAFVDVHSVDVLTEFRERCKEIRADVEVLRKGMTKHEALAFAEGIIDPVPAKGELDLSDVMKSEYFFS